MFWSVEELETLPAGTKPRASGGERRRKKTRSTIFIERTREGHCQSDQHWNCLKSNAEVTSEKRGGAQMVIPECVDIILSWAELLHKYPPFWHVAVTRLATRHILKNSVSFLPRKPASNYPSILFTHCVATFRGFHPESPVSARSIQSTSSETLVQVG